jgi:hypothetical protein
MHKEEWEGGRVGGEEAVACKGGLGDEERDGGGFSCCSRVTKIRLWQGGGGGGRGGAHLRNQEVGIGIGTGVGGGESVNGTFELAEVCRSHFALFRLALDKDAYSSPVRRVPVSRLCGDVEERI